MSTDVSLEDAIAALARRANDVRRRFAAYEVANIGREWTTAEVMSGFVVDVGDLTRLVMAATGARQVRDQSELRSQLEHELADCLWSVLVLSERLDVDLAAAFDRTMRELTEVLDSEQEGPRT